MVSVCVHFVLLLCSTCSLPINGKIYLPNTNTTSNDMPLAETAAYLVRKYFSKHSSTVTIIEKSMDPDLRDYNRDIFEYISQNLDEAITLNLYFGESKNQPWEYTIFIVDSEAAFIQIIWAFHKNNFDVEFRFLIVLTNYATEYFQALDNIFSACKSYNVINVNILLNHRLMGVCMFNYNIFSETKCDVVQPYLFFRISDGLDNLTEMFPPKLQNFHGCQLRICGQQQNTMLTFSGNESNPKPEENWRNLGGIDGHLIRVLSRRLNFTIDLLPFPKGKTYFDNITGYGCFAELLSNNADIAIGGLSGSDPHRFGLTLSIFYFDSPIVFVMRGKREFDRANRLGRPFSIRVWHSIFGLLIFLTMLIQALWMLKPSARQFVFGQGNYSPLSNFLATFLGYPVARTPTRNFARYLLILWLLTTFILRNAYQGSLYDSIRIDRFEQIPKNYEELFKRNYTFLISKFYSDIDILSASHAIVVVADERDERLRKLENIKGNFATLALRDHVFVYLEKNARHGSNLKIIDEAVYLFRTAVYFQKHSIYLTTFNAKLRTLNYAGILNYIIRSNCKDSQMFKKHSMATPLKPISNNRIWSLYQMCLLLVGASIVVFTLELLSGYFEKLRNILAWLH